MPTRSYRSALGPLRLLLAGCLLLPLALFVLASWYNYRSALADAYRGLERAAEVAREHASKVLDGQSQVADRVNDILRGLSVAEVQAAEKRLHDQFANIVIRLPQVSGVLLAGADGTPLVSASVYPIPRGVSVADRDYHQAVMVRRAELFVTDVQVGSLNATRFMGLAVPWRDADGHRVGVVDVSTPPDAFEDFYGVLATEMLGSNADAVALLTRADGVVLIRYPSLPAGAATGMRPAPGLELAVGANADAGTYEAVSAVDGVRRLFAFRKVEGYPVYVVVGRSRDGVMGGWLSTMRSHVVFGLPATLALLAITWTALVRTRREEEALVRAGDEIRRREKAEAALLRAQRLEAVGQMTGGVAHDFNNLLTIILGSAEALVRRPGDVARVERIAGQIGAAARRGGEITQQLLAFSRRQFVNPRVLDLNACLEEFRPLLQRACNERVRIVYDLQPGLPPAWLDPGHFEAAVLNLVGNARDAMPGGGVVTVTTREEPRTGAGHFLRVGVTDTGHGMDPATAAKAFEPFFTTKGVGQGTGLGLSQVYGFAQQSGGDARILSAPGLGTTVLMLLPVTDAQPAGLPAGRAVPGEAAAGGVVLVVEDEPMLLDTVAESLAELGYETLVASNAQEAMEQIRRAGRVDLLFSDITMPGSIDGVQLAERAREVRPELKVLLTSGYSATRLQLPAGLRLLTKPYDRSRLAAELRATLDGVPSPAPSSLQS